MNFIMLFLSIGKITVLMICYSWRKEIGICLAYFLLKTRPMKNILVILLFLPYPVLGQLHTDDQNNHQNGIFFGTKNLQSYPTVLSGIQNKNTVLAVLSFGIASQSRLPFLSFAQSNHIVAEPQFQFRFQRPLHNEFGFLEPDRFFRGAVSPNEFLLLKLIPHTKRNVR